MLKKTFKITALIFAICVAFYFYLLSDYNPMFKNEDFIYITKTLKNTKAEDLESIIILYNKIQEKEPSGCACEAVLHNINSYAYGNLFKKAVYTAKLKKEFTEDVCLKLELLNFDFGFRVIGIHNASQFYFHKTVKELNEREKLTFIAMTLRNPILYNPIRNKKRLDNKILKYQQILHQNQLK